ncbi:Uncharacterized protein ToN1_34210 [Aromatoleum petrolei]|nr:Uncharacterized protein ToN1_34210 [Aromatoleum petrolei]
MELLEKCARAATDMLIRRQAACQDDFTSHAPERPPSAPTGRCRI